MALYGITFFPLLKDGSVYPVLKEVIKEALKHLYLVFKEFAQFDI